MSLRVCVEWAEESFNECLEWQTTQEQSCTNWDEQCCDWWPCSWLCEIVTWVCVAWTWITTTACVAWTTITTLVCVAWEIVAVILTPVAILIEAILAIPILGRLIDEILNIVTSIIWRIAAIPDGILSAIGVRPLKKLRLCIVILRDENGTPVTTEAALQPDIAAAEQIFRDAANIEIIVDGIRTVDNPSPTVALDVNCDLGAWGDDLTLAGSYFELASAWHCPTGALGRVTGYANPVVVFCVRSIPGATAGCALGPVTDYLTIEGGNPICLAHEIGHKVGLWHCCPGTNLANPICGGTLLEWWQVTIARNSEYVTYV